MTGKELIAVTRNDILDDVQIPYLWSDAEILRNLNYGEVQACRRAHLIIDSSTANDSGTAATAGTAGQKPLCQVSIIANTATYNLSPKILQVRRCQLSSMTYPLDGPKTYAELDDFSDGWTGTGGLIGTTGTGGVPQYFINEPGNTITFVKRPTDAATAYLVVSRIPLLSFTINTSPEIMEQYHYGLCNWAAKLCYSKNDSETFNLAMAKEYEARFIQEFGQLPDAYSERMRRTVLQQGSIRPRVFGS